MERLSRESSVIPRILKREMQDGQIGTATGEQKQGEKVINQRNKNSLEKIRKRIWKR